MRGVRKTSEGVLLLAVKVGFLLWWLFVFCERYAPDSPYIIIVCVRIHGSSFLRKRRHLTLRALDSWEGGGMKQ